MPELEQHLTLTVDKDSDGAIVAAAGELEYATAGELRNMLLGFAHDGTTRVVLDLSAIDFVDSTGISLLVQAKQRFEAQGSVFVLRKPSNRVLRVLEVSGLVSLFEIETDGSAAR
ncbi:MAG: STAS domain-containing protein [Actinomycetota bacterium]